MGSRSPRAAASKMLVGMSPESHPANAASPAPFARVAAAGGTATSRPRAAGASSRISGGAATIVNTPATASIPMNRAIARAPRAPTGSRSPAPTTAASTCVMTSGSTRSCRAATQMLPNGSSAAASSVIALLPDRWPSRPRTSPETSAASDRIVNERNRAPVLTGRRAAFEPGAPWMAPMIDEVVDARRRFGASRGARFGAASNDGGLASGDPDPKDRQRHRAAAVSRVTA